MKTPLALLACAALLLPAAVLASPGAEAATTGPIIIKNCAEKVDGVPIRIKMRFEMKSASDPNKVRLLRIRVSHPDGSGNFRERRVTSTLMTVSWGRGSDTGSVGPFAIQTRKPTYRLALGNTPGVGVRVKFKLRNGETERVSCYHEFHGD